MKDFNLELKRSSQLTNALDTTEMLHHKYMQSAETKKKIFQKQITPTINILHPHSRKQDEYQLLNQIPASKTFGCS